MSAGGTLFSSAGGSSGAKRPRTSGAFDDGESSGGGGQSGASVAGAKGAGKGKEKAKKSVMEVLMEQEQARKMAREEEEEKTESKKNAADGRKDYWLREGIVVKVMNKKVGGGKYYKKKARLRKVVERYVGEVKMLDSGDRLRVDQEDLETVSSGWKGDLFNIWSMSSRLRRRCLYCVMEKVASGLHSKKCFVLVCLFR